MYGTNARSPEKSICWRKKPRDTSLFLSDVGFNNKAGLVIFLDLVLRVLNAALVMILPLQIPVSSELKILYDSHCGTELRVATGGCQVSEGNIIPCDGGTAKCKVGGYDRVQRCGISIKAGACAINFLCNATYNSIA